MENFGDQIDKLKLCPCKSYFRDMHTLHCHIYIAYKHVTLYIKLYSPVVSKFPKSQNQLVSGHCVTSRLHKNG